MEIIIQKFGGTSVATQENRRRVAAIVKNTLKEKKQVVVVVSAMGRLGEPYATDTLMSLIGQHRAKVSPKEKDLLISTGEIISTVVMSNTLREEGISSMAVTGGEAGIITTDQFNNAEIIGIDPEYLHSLLEQNIVPVIAGFQGRTIHHITTTIGRGGSDTTASVIGEALNAKCVEIYTDVNGIMTADPKYCKHARSIQTISYDEVFQMADSGAKVIHKGAVEVAKRSNIPLIIKNTFSDHNGTQITEYVSLNEVYEPDNKIITGIAHRVDRIQFIIKGAFDTDAFYNALAEKKVSIDIINIFPDHSVFTTELSSEFLAIDVIKQFDLEYSLIRGCAKVTVIGERMTGVPGVMARIIHALKQEDIEILQTADSLSTIACLVYEKDMEKAIMALHQAFDL
jgi:aspartate kinase